MDLDFVITGSRQLDLLIKFLGVTSFITVLIHVIWILVEQKFPSKICRHCKYKSWRPAPNESRESGERTELICNRGQKVVGTDPITGIQTMSECPTLESERSRHGSCGPEGINWRPADPLASVPLWIGLLVMVFGSLYIIMNCTP